MPYRCQVVTWYIGKTEIRSNFLFFIFFRSFDTDGDGYITLEELIDVLKALGQDFSREEAEAMIRDADTDGDGKINFIEFENMIVSRE